MPGQPEDSGEENQTAGLAGPWSARSPAHGTGAADDSARRPPSFRQKAAAWAHHPTSLGYPAHSPGDETAHSPENPYQLMNCLPPSVFHSWPIGLLQLEKRIRDQALCLLEASGRTAEVA